MLKQTNIDTNRELHMIQRHPWTAWLSLLAIVMNLLSLPVYAQIRFDDSLYTVTRTTPASPEHITRDYLLTKTLLENTSNRLQQAIDSWRDAPLGRAEIDMIIAQMAMINVEAMINSQDYEGASRDLDIALQRLRRSQLSFMNSRPVEMRSMYLDAGGIPKTQEGIIKLLDELKAANFNTIIPEVFRRGYTIYPSQLTDQDPELKDIGFDALGELVREARRRNMQIIPWYWAFRVKSPGFGNPVLKRVPALAAMPADPDEIAKIEARFLSPAHPDSREYLYRLLQEMLDRYPVHGILLDYIRYDELISEDAISVTMFREEYYKKHKKYPPLKIEYGSDLFIDWQMWREAQVNKTVEMLKNRLKGYRGETVPLSVATFRGESYSRLTKMQHWRHWSDNNWIKTIHSMLYTADKNDLATWIDWETDRDKRRNFFHPILGAHRFNSPDDIFGQIGIIHNLHAHGVGIFALSHFKKSNLPDLLTGSFRKPAILAEDDLHTALRVLAEDMAFWLERIADTPKAPAAEKLRNIAKELSAASNTYRMGEGKRYGYSLTPLNTPLNHFKAVVSELQEKKELPLALAQEIQHKLDYPLRLIEIEKQRRQNATHYTPSKPPSLAILPETRALPEVRIPYIAQPPQIDGDLADPFWAQAAEIRVNYWHNGVSKTGVGTTVRLGYNQDNLYIAYSNEEEYMNKVKATVTKMDDGNIFISDDAIEVMLALANQPHQYQHFVLNNQNIRYDGAQADSKWDGQWKSQVIRLSQGWQVEMAIPASDLKLTSFNRGLKLAANFYRDRYQDTNPYYAWSAPYKSYHTPARFGTLVLD